jgi:hypothetical protein
VTPFDFVAGRLEACSSLSRLEARGTVRIALRNAGLDASAGPRELAVVLRKVLPGELGARGIEAGAALCEDIARALAQQAFEAKTHEEGPEEIFRRLAGS